MSAVCGSAEPHKQGAREGPPFPLPGGRVSRMSGADAPWLNHLMSKSTLLPRNTGRTTVNKAQPQGGKYLKEN